MSSNDFSGMGNAPVTNLEYRNIESHAGARPDLVSGTESMSVQLTENELAQKLSHAATAARTEIETRLRREFETRLNAERAMIAKAIEGFRLEQNDYYSRVEGEVVQLALSIATKILHREAQIDKMLLAALVRLAIENLQHRSNVTVRLRPEKCGPWRNYFAQHLKGTKVEILEDSHLGENDCVLETELGAADVSLDAQVKEIERGFFDLLAQRPEAK